VKITCHKGYLDLGPNLAIGLVDISETGARLIVKTPLEKGQQVAISLEGREHIRPIRTLGTVVRSEPGTDGACQLAVLWEKRLTFSEILRMT
jgi:hypothetical protein